MILPTDIPTRAQLDGLLAAREPWSVSIYVPTDPSSRGDVARIELKTLAGEAVSQLQQAGAARNDVGAIEEEVADLVDDDEFWRYQARSLALFLTPTRSTTYRLPHNLTSIVEVSDRFHLKPLLRALTFQHTAFVLAVSQGSIRVLEIAPELDPAKVAVPGLRRTWRARSASRRSRTAHPAAGSRAPKDRRPGCASTRGRSTRRCGRCSAASTCR